MCNGLVAGWSTIRDFIKVGGMYCGGVEVSTTTLFGSIRLGNEHPIRQRFDEFVQRVSFSSVTAPCVHPEVTADCITNYMTVRYLCEMSLE